MEKPVKNRLIGAGYCHMMVMIVSAIAIMVLAGCAGSDSGDEVTFEARLAGRSIADAGPFDPVELHHEDVTELSLTVTNVSDEPVTVAHVRLEGQLLNLIFLTYDTGIHETIQPGEQRTIAFALDFFDLDGQAHGLLRSHIRLFDPDRRPLGQQALVIDGRGSPLATMAVFNIVLAAVAVASLTWNLARLAQRRLPVNQFVRGLRFLHTGAALGLTISAAASTLRIWPLPTTSWLVLTIVASLAGFALGYTAPGGNDDFDDDLGDPLVIDLAEGHVGSAVELEGEDSLSSSTALSLGPPNR